MSVEENIKLINMGTKAINDHDFEALEKLYAADAVAIMPESPEPIKGSKEIAALGRQYLESFPDAHMEDDLVIGQNDWVCMAGSWSGTNTGPLTMPDGTTLSATNKRIKVPMCILFKVKDGKVVEERDYYDQMSFMTQLGLSQT